MAEQKKSQNNNQNNPFNFIPQMDNEMASELMSLHTKHCLALSQSVMEQSRKVMDMLSNNQQKSMNHAKNYAEDFMNVRSPEQMHEHNMQHNPNMAKDAMHSAQEYMNIALESTQRLMQQSSNYANDIAACLQNSHKKQQRS